MDLEELREYKKKLRIESAEKHDNEKLTEWLMSDDDCFGRGYDDDNKYCKECNVNTGFYNFDEHGNGPIRHGMLREFCAEACVKEVEDEGSKEPKATKRFGRF